MLRLFLQKLKFKGASLDEALRSMVVRFRLPGEAQQMDRFVLGQILFQVVDLSQETFDEKAWFCPHVRKPFYVARYRRRGGGGAQVQKYVSWPMEACLLRSKSVSPLCCRAIRTSTASFHVYVATLVPLLVRQ